ncbi:MAG: hypothetical protein ACOY71_04885 [Gemmatimonadota bacterium]
MIVIAALFALALAAPGRPTVGDTIRVAVRVPAVITGEASLAAWEPSEPFELVGRPSLVRHGAQADVRVNVVAWQPGRYTLRLPAVIVITPGGVDSLPGGDVTVTVASVLPPNQPDSSLAPQPVAAIVAQTATSWGPVAASLAAALALLLPFWVLRLRRGPRTPPPPVGRPTEPTEAALEQWEAMGEGRAVAIWAAARLRMAVAAGCADADPHRPTADWLAVIRDRRPEWPAAEIAELADALDLARFGADAPAGVAALAARTIDLSARLVARP